MTKFKRYEYPLRDAQNKVYKGSYSIKSNVKPLGFENEKLVQEFEVDLD